MTKNRQTNKVFKTAEKIAVLFYAIIIFYRYRKINDKGIFKITNRNKEKKTG